MAPVPDTADTAVSRPSRTGWSRAAVATFVVAFAAVVMAAEQGLGAGQRLLLFNPTPSEPIGLYVRAPGAVHPGQLVAFAAPAAAFPYADQRLGYLHRIPLLKAVAAGPGDVVCTLGGRLVINGRDLAPIAVVDGQGRALPRWRGCRALATGEVFVFSDRVPNSFDSRYFGPVPATSIVGVFTPLFQSRGGG